MRTSCNGCRVLRKGCSEDCNIRPCIQWIKSSEYQANATLFLAKFYGRAGLMNLINAGPDHLRPAIFKSLLYEACGRIVDPIQGSVGLLWSGNWHHCQAGVEAVLKGSQIMQIHPNPEDAAASHLINLPTAAYDIRHASRDTSSAASPNSQKVKMTRTRSKRTRSKREVDSGAANLSTLMSAPFGKSDESYNDDRGASHDPDESMFSAQTVEASLVNRVNPDSLLKYGNQIGDDSEVGLELSLGLSYVVKAKGQNTINGSDHGDKMDVGS